MYHIFHIVSTKKYNYIGIIDSQYQFIESFSKKLLSNYSITTEDLIVIEKAKKEEIKNEVGFYLVCTKNYLDYQLIKKEKITNTGYIWNSDDIKTDIIGEWKLIEASTTNSNTWNLNNLNVKEYDNKIKIKNCDNLKFLKLLRGSINITHLEFDGSHKIKQGQIPATVTHLTLNSYYNIEPNVLPMYLTHITFEDEFNLDLKKNVIPDSVIYLKFGDDFNKSLQYLPDSIIELILGDNFQEEIIYPKSLKKLTISSKYKQQDIIINECLKKGIIIEII